MLEGKTLTKKEFIQKIRDFADLIEKGEYATIWLENGGQIFGNRNFGSVSIPVTTGCRIEVDLYMATQEEREEAMRMEVQP